MKKYQRFLSENFQFLEVKFSIYLNRRVFVMLCSDTVRRHPTLSLVKYEVIIGPFGLPLCVTSTKIQTETES